MLRVIDLQPGDKIVGKGVDGDRTATFLVQQKHPLYPGLQLVVWWLHEEGSWSFDALSPIQVVGQNDPECITFQTRQANLRAILHHQVPA
jgi:hypothetical protein